MKNKAEQTMEDTLKVLTVRLPSWLHKALKVKAAQEDRTVQEVAVKVFSKYVRK